MTRARWIAVGVLALVAEALAVRFHIIADPLPKLAGNEAWITSRAAGVTAFAALALDVVFGLFCSTGLLDRWVPRGASIDVHRWLSGVALSLVAVHAGALLADGYVRFDAIDLVVPWSSAYRPTAVAIGVLAFHAALVVHASFGWRKRIGTRVWRALHFTAFAVFVAAVVHGLTAGSDAQHVGLRALYASTAAVVLGLVAVRVVLAMRARAARCC